MARTKVIKDGKKRWYELDPKKHGIAGLTKHFPKKRKQDRRALPWEGYVVEFFPQYRLGWKAQLGFNSAIETLSKTPEAARVRYADSIGGAEHPAKKWDTYYQAGHRVRRVRLIDLGPA